MTPERLGTMTESTLMLDDLNVEGVHFVRCRLVAQGLHLPRSIINCTFDGCAWDFNPRIRLMPEYVAVFDVEGMETVRHLIRDTFGV